jgi:N,N-dimethylformamidase
MKKSIVAYADPLSVCAGDTLTVRVSCGEAGEYTAQLVRLVSGDERSHGTGFREIAIAASFAGSYPAEFQPIVRGSYAVLPDLPSSRACAFACNFYPTLLTEEDQTIVRGGECSVRVSRRGLAVVVGSKRVDVAARLETRRWHRLAVSIGTTIAVRLECTPSGPAETLRSWRASLPAQGFVGIPAGAWELAREAPGRGHFNGRIEAPRLYGVEMEVRALLRESSVERDADPALLGAWDFAQQIETERVIDVSGRGRHGRLVQMPTRGVTGMHWRGDVFDWRRDPSQYAAVHFHDDDLVDAAWRPSFTWRIPNDLGSGVYAVKLELGNSEDYVPFFVRPATNHPRARAAYLIPTATYLAYANQRLAFNGEIFPPRAPNNPNEVYLVEHPEVGDSLYEYHRDRSGVHFSSRLRPVLNLKPKNTPWAFTADLNIVAWLDGTGQRYDVITDEDLHREGLALLARYAVVLTGTHPEYYSTAMHDALAAWLDRGGRLMYMGGNGFYWRIAFHPENPAIIEVRRAEDGTRAWIAEPGEYHHAFGGEYGGLWRRLGRPPNALVGVGFAAQGFDGGTYYRIQPGARDPRVAFVMDGVNAETILGNHGTQGGGAAGEELDRWDASLGSPHHALVIASSENHRPGMLRVKEELHMSIPHASDPNVRADMTFFETPSGGAVFSTGSISYAGALATFGYDNDIARLTGNVLRRFLDPTPFVYPGDPDCS